MRKWFELEGLPSPQGVKRVFATRASKNDPIVFAPVVPKGSKILKFKSEGEARACVGNLFTSGEDNLPRYIYIVTVSQEVVTERDNLCAYKNPKAPPPRSTSLKRGEVCEVLVGTKWKRGTVVAVSKSESASGFCLSVKFGTRDVQHGIPASSVRVPAVVTP
jgi:hypothetical protein